MKLVFENNNDILDLSEPHKIENESQIIKEIYFNFYKNKIILNQQNLNEKEELKENFIFDYDFSLIKDQKKFRHNNFALELTKYLEKLFPFYRGLFIFKNYVSVDEEELHNLFLNLYQIIGSFLSENKSKSIYNAIAFNKWICDETLESMASYLFELDLSKDRLTRERIRQILGQRIIPLVNDLFYFFGLDQVNYPILLDASQTNSTYFYNFLSFLYQNKGCTLTKAKTLILIDKSSDSDDTKKETSNLLEHIYPAYDFFNLEINDQMKFIKSPQCLFSIENKVFFKEEISKKSSIRFLIKTLPALQLDKKNLKELANFYSLISKIGAFEELFINSVSLKNKKSRIYTYINDPDLFTDENYFLPIDDSIIVNKKFIKNFENLKTIIFNELLSFRDNEINKIGYYEIKRIIDYMPPIQLDLINETKNYSMSVKFFYFLVKREFSDIFNFNNKNGYWIYFQNLNIDLENESLERLNIFLDNFDDFLLDLNELIRIVDVGFNTLLTNKRYSSHIAIIGKNSGINLNFLKNKFQNLPENQMFIEEIQKTINNFPYKSCFIETLTDQVFDFLKKNLNRPLSSLKKGEKNALVRGYLQKFSDKILIKNRLVTLDPNISNIESLLNATLEGRLNLDIVKFKNDFVNLYKLGDTNLQFLYSYFDNLISAQKGIMINQDTISFDWQNIKEIEEINGNFNNEFKKSKELLILNGEEFDGYSIYTLLNALIFNKKYKVIFIKNYPLVRFRQFKQEMIGLILANSFYKKIKDFYEEEDINYLDVINYLEDKDNYREEFNLLSVFSIRGGAEIVKI